MSLTTLLPALREALADGGIDGGVDAARALARALGGPLGPRLDEALRLSTEALAQDPEALEAQLLGRLHGASPEETALRDACAATRPGLRTRAASLTPPFPPTPRDLATHRRQINALCALDARRLLVASEDGTLCVRAASTGELIAALDDHIGPVNAAQLSPDGGAFVTAGDDETARVWDAATLRCLHVLEGHGAYVRDAAIGDRHVLTASEDKGVRLWSRRTGELLETFTEHSEHPSVVAIHPDGELGLSGSVDNDLLRWDLTTPAPDGAVYKTESLFASLGRLYISGGTAPEHGHRDGPKAMAFTPEGVLVSGADSLIRWNPDLATAAWTAPQAWGVNDLVIEAGRGLVVTAAHSVGVFDLATGDRLATLPTPDREATALALSPDGQTLYVGGNKGGLIALPLDPERFVAERHSSYVYSVEVSPDGRRAATMDSDNTPAVWDLATGRRLASLEEHPESGSRAIAWGEAGELLTSRQDAKEDDAPNLFVRDADGAVLHTLRVVQAEHPDRPVSVHALLGLPSGEVMVGAMGEGLFRTQPSDGLQRRVDGQTKQLSHLACSADARFILSLGYFAPPTADGSPSKAFGDNITQLQCWDLVYDALLWTVPAIKPEGVRWGGGFSHVHVRGDEVVHSVGGPDHRVVTRELETGELRQTWPLPGWCSELILHGAREWALVGIGEQAPLESRLVELLPGGETRELPLPDDTNGFAINPELELLLVTVGQELLRLNMEGEVLDRLRFDARLRGLVLHPTEALAVVGDAEGGVHVVEVD